MKVAAVRFFFDENIIGLAKIVSGVRNDVTYPGYSGATNGPVTRPPCPIEPGAKDIDWLPRIAALGWPIITRDTRLTRRRAEVAAIREHDAKVFVIASNEGLNVWGQLEVLMHRWRDVEAIASVEPGPFAYGLTRASARRINLDGG